MKSIKEILDSEITLNGTSVSLKKKHHFFNDLAVLLSTGVNLKETIQILFDETKDKKLIKLYSQIQKDINSGLPLSESIEKTKQFSKYEVFNLKMGEETGRIVDTLFNLADFLSSKIDLKRKINSALSYPIIVFITAIGSVGFMLGFVVPMFQDIFKRMNQELPPITQRIIYLSDNAGTIMLYSFVFISLIIASHLILRRYLKYRLFIGYATIKTPYFGEFVRKTSLSRFCTSMELFIKSGIPVLTAINALQEMDNFQPMKTALLSIEKEILKGVAFDHAIQHHSIFDKRLSTLIRVGMEVNQLPQMFGKMKKEYNEDVNYKASLLNSVLEPIMILFIGIIVATILVSMYLPIFQLSTSMGL